MCGHVCIDILLFTDEIFQVPLPAVHHLREAINTLPPNAHIPSDLLAKYDAPVIASTLKLWLLELNPPIGVWEGWEDVRKIYPTGWYHIHHYAVCPNRVR